MGQFLMGALVFATGVLFGVLIVHATYQSVLHPDD